NIKRVSYMDFTLNKPRQIIYYNSRGQAYFTQWKNPKNGKTQRILLFDKGGTLSKTYINDVVSPKVDWLKAVVDNNKKNGKSVVVSDTRSTDETLIELNHPRVAKIWRLHSNHLNSPYRLDSEIAPKVKKGYNNIDKFDAVTFLTQEQKYDVMNRVGEKSNIHVIPHFHEEPGFSIKSLFNSVVKKPKTAVVISRLSSLKRIDHIIKAFEIAIKTVPDADLEIWGIGQEESKLKQLVADLNLEESVHFKRYTHTPDREYQQGSFSVLTSKSEGFALSVLESMYNKTPVISYKIKYGPSDMIVNNDNGFIIEQPEIEELANRMIHMFENPDKAIEMGSKARKYIDKNFNKNVYKEKWMETVNSALDRKFGK